MALSGMCVIHDRGPGREANRVVAVTMSREAGDTGESVFRAWTPYRQLAFSRRDTRVSRYGETAATAEERGLPAIERSVDGRVVAYTGTTVVLAHVVSLDSTRSGFGAQYEVGATAVVRVLRALGIPAWRGEPLAPYHPGDHLVQAGGKFCGLAQCTRKEGALVSGVAVVADRDEIASVLVPVYEATDVPFDPDSVGSIADAGGPAGFDTVCDTLEAAFAGNAETCVEGATDFA